MQYNNVVQSNIQSAYANRLSDAIRTKYRTAEGLYNRSAKHPSPQKSAPELKAIAEANEVVDHCHQLEKAMRSELLQRLPRQTPPGMLPFIFQTLN